MYVIRIILPEGGGGREICLNHSTTPSDDHYAILETTINWSNLGLDFEGLDNIKY